MNRIALVWLLLLASSLGFAAPKATRNPERIGQRDVGKGLNFYSIKSEIALGKELARAVEREVRVFDDSVISEYVNRIGQNLVRNSDASVIFTIKVIRSHEVNAFALPGGFLYVTTGLMLAVDNESELASAMAHEIAHVAARHGTREATRREILDRATIPLVFIGGWPGLASRLTVTVAVPIAFLKLSRGAERQADMLGLQYLYKAGYDPVTSIDLLEKLSRREQKSGIFSSMLSAHPATKSRLHAVQNQIQKDLAPRAQYLLQTSEFELVKLRLAAIVSGRAFREGFLGLRTLRRAPESTDCPPILKRPDLRLQN